MLGTVENSIEWKGRKAFNKNCDVNCCVAVVWRTPSRSNIEEAKKEEDDDERGAKEAYNAEVVNR